MLFSFLLIIRSKEKIQCFRRFDDLCHHFQENLLNMKIVHYKKRMKYNKVHLSGSGK